MTDAVTRFMLENLDVRGSIVKLTDSWQKIQAKRDYPPSVRELLGQMCAVTALIAANLKQPGRLTFQLSGHGAVSLLVIDCSDQLNLRGYAKHGEMPEAAQGVRALLGDGRLLMSLDNEDARQPYQSYVPIEGDSIAAVFGHYLEQSEQQSALLVLSANATQAAGLFLQKLPGADAKDADGWNRVQHLVNTLSEEELRALDPITLLERLFGEETVRVFEAQPARHHFPPDREKISNMLRGLGAEEVERIIAEHGEIVIQDDLSNNEYRFDAAEALSLFAPAAPPTLH